MVEAMYQALLTAREGRGAAITVVQPDRWSSSLADALGSLERLYSAGVGFRSLTENIDLGTPGGIHTVSVLGAVAQYERALLRERVIEAMRVKGLSVFGGRPRRLTPASMTLERRMEDEALSTLSVTKQFGVSTSGRADAAVTA